MNYLYHEKLFDFQAAFKINQQHLRLHPDALSIQVENAENHFTTGRFAEAISRMNTLIINPKVEEKYKIVLSAEQIVALIALDRHIEAQERLVQLEALVTKQTTDFKTGWAFSGVLHFIQQHEKLADIPWAVDFIKAFAGDRTTMLDAIAMAHSELNRHQVDEPVVQ